MRSRLGPWPSSNCRLFWRKEHNAIEAIQSLPLVHLSKLGGQLGWLGARVVEGRNDIIVGVMV